MNSAQNNPHQPDVRAAVAGATQPQSPALQMKNTKASNVRSPFGAAIYLASTLAMTVAGLCTITELNKRYAPEMYGQSYMGGVADAFANGENYGVFDLNINIRQLREEQFKRLPQAPAVTILGASQWQEAGANLYPRSGYLNAHVHRDYYEDVVGMVHVMAKYDRLPKDLVITIRDRTFTPVSQRADYLWLPGINYYQSAADRFQLPKLSFWETQPLQRPRELISLPMLFANTTRWHNATEWPYPTLTRNSETLDLLHPDGSISWSTQHKALFTLARARKLALAHADANKSRPPVIDPKGVEALDRVLSYLGVRGVRVHLAHPPFNPLYFDAVRGTKYMDGLRQVAAVTSELAEKHKLGQVGGFDPEKLGCTSEMFIDAEHSNAGCLQALLGDVVRSIDQKLSPIDGGANDISDRLSQVSGEQVAARVSRLRDDGAAISQVPDVSPKLEQQHKIAGPPVATDDRLNDKAPPATPLSASKNRQATRLTSAPIRERTARQYRPKRITNKSKPSSEATSRLVWPGDSPSRAR